MNPNTPDPSGQFAVQRQPRADLPIEYTPFGGTDKIKLTARIIIDQIATPTAKGARPNENDAIKFLMLCKSRALNPWEGDCFMLGYDTQDGPKYSLITAHQAFLKRAEPHPEFDGMESGIIVSPAVACAICRSEGGREVSGNWVVCSACKGVGQTDELEGDLIPEGHALLGGWAKIHFKNRKIPMKKRLSMRAFDKGQSRWKIDPAGMIVKCAEADALRSSFPTKLGGLYLREEQEIPITAQVVTPTDLTVPTKTLQPRRVSVIENTREPEQMPAQPEPEPSSPSTGSPQPPEPPKETKPAKPAKTDKPKTKPLDALRNVMTLESITEAELAEYAVRHQGAPPGVTLEALGDSGHDWLLRNFDDVRATIQKDRAEQA